MAVEVAADLGGALMFLKFTILLVFEGDKPASELEADAELES